MQWIPLGTNGFFPSFGRQTMSFLVFGEETALLLDAGTGVGRLAEPALAERIAGIERLEVLLTHYHLDHVIGLACLPAVFPGRIVVHAPQRPLVDAEAKATLERLIGPPLFPRPLAEQPIEVRPYAADRLTVGTWDLRLRRQRHAGGSVGVRVGDELAYVTDTEVEAATVDLARGVGTLLHEVWWSDGEAAAPAFTAGGHSWPAGVADLANRANVRRLVPIHHHPRRDARGLAAVAAELAAASACEVLAVEESREYQGASGPVGLP